MIASTPSALLRRRNTARYVNHSCKPNAEPYGVKGKIKIYARRNIAPGEEITLDQGTWNTGDDYMEDRESCSCRAANCRGMLTETDWKRIDVQEQYAGHFHPLVAALMKSR